MKKNKLFPLKRFVNIKTYDASREKNAEGKSSHARQILFELLEENSISLNVDNINYSDEIENFSWSLSHTEGASGCGFINKINWPMIESFGVDIEKKSRVIPNLLEENFFHSEDIITNPLLCWVTKEAIFKAISKVYNDVFELRNIILNEKYFSFELNEKIRGLYDYWEYEEYIVAGGVVLK